jgi:hypothetical protein
MLWKKKQETDSAPVDRPKEGASVGQASFKGHELIVNPTVNMVMERLEARLRRINQSLDAGKFEVGSSKYLEMTSVKRKLEMQLALAKGEF